MNGLVSTSLIAPDLFLKPRYSEWPWHGLEPLAYSLIMIDCPWRFITRSVKGEGKSPQSKYRTMSLDEIAVLPVADLAAENCLIWMWGTAPLAHKQPAILEAWGFKFCTEGVWVKTTVHGKVSFGQGYGLRNCHEPFFIGKRGSPKIASKSIRSVVFGPLREHSRKPDEAYVAARALIPYGRAADVFSRESRPTWESTGDEAGKFDQEAKHVDQGTRAGKSRSRRRSTAAGGGTPLLGGPERAGSSARNSGADS